MTKLEKNICIACGMDILDNAKKCPHCHSLQVKGILLFAKPSVLFIIIMFLMILFGGIIFDVYYNEIYKHNIPFSKYSNKFEVTTSKIYYSGDNPPSYISCIGHLKNNTNLTWKKITIEVQYFNSIGELIDTITLTDYDLVAPPMSSITFRVRGKSDKNREQYVSHKVMVKWAKIYD